MSRPNEPPKSINEFTMMLSSELVGRLKEAEATKNLNFGDVIDKYTPVGTRFSNSNTMEVNLGHSSNMHHSSAGVSN
jgi:hypothetical protein